MDLGILQVLAAVGFTPTAKCYFVRHQDKRYPVEDVGPRLWLEHYQEYQSRSRFHNADQLVSFYGLTGTRAGFFGIYNVRGHRPASEGRIVPECPWSTVWREPATVFYDLERDKRFDDLRDRIIIDWGTAYRTWVQKASNKPVLEVQEPGRRLPPFDDYLEFSVSYADLKNLFANEEAHREWRARLGAVAGVYLILAEGTGNLYVGSASGEGGIWARWREYAKTGHGGNKLLRELTKAGSDYPTRFRFSVLQVLPKSMSRDEVLRREAIYKAKLGSRAMGLNAN